MLTKTATPRARSSPRRPSRRRSPKKSPPRPRLPRNPPAPLSRRSGRCRNGTCRRSMRGSARRRSSATSPAPTPIATASRSATRASSRASRAGRMAGAALAAAIKELEAIDDLHRPHRLLRPARLHRQHRRPRPRQVLRRRAGTDHHVVLASAVLFARAQQDRRRRAGPRDGGSRARPLPAVDRGCPQGEALSARGPHRAAVPRKVGDRPGRLEPAVRRHHRQSALQGRRQDAGASSRRSICSRTAARRPAGPPPRRWPRPSARTCAPSR